MRSMFAGVSGMKAHQTMMDVIGDNIANINSSGYKASRVVFQDTLSQLMRDGKLATATTGAVDPAQVGLGVKLNAIDAVVTQGAVQSTGRPSDMAIQGNGYFPLQLTDGSSAYTRSGSFNLDSEGHLVDPAGGILKGYQAQGDGTFSQDFTSSPPPAPDLLKIPTLYDPADQASPKLRSFSIGPDGVVNAVYDNSVTKAVGRVALTLFDNPAGLIKAGDGRLLEGTASGPPTTNAASTNGTGTLAAGALEMSNVDLSQEFTNMMIAQRGFQANSKVITTSDEMLQELVNLKR
jgi:flagellar hook protein FlgE